MTPAIAIEQTELSKHLTDLNALLSHFSNVVKEQVEIGEKGRHTSLILNQKLHGILEKHKSLVEQKCELYAGSIETGAKEVFTNVLGSAAGLYNRMRDYPETRALRDNYTALSLLAASLTSLKTYGLMLGKEDVSKMAYDMLAEICPLIMEFSHKMPEIIARETAEREGLLYKQEVADRVTNAVKRCWGQ